VLKYGDKKMTDGNLTESRICDLEIGSIVVIDERNPRHTFEPQSLFALGESMEEVSQLQPIIVNRVDKKNYLVAGERRLRAAKEAGRNFIEAKVFKKLSPVQSHRMAMAENHERVALNVIEQARSHATAIELGIPLAEITIAQGCMEATIKSRLQLLKLPEEVQSIMTREIMPLPVHQALLLLKLKKEADIIQMARRVAPRTGPIASEEAVREWVKADLDKREKKLDFVEEPKTESKPIEKGCEICSKKRADDADWQDDKLVCTDCREDGWKPAKGGVRKKTIAVKVDETERADDKCETKMEVDDVCVYIDGQLCHNDFGDIYINPYYISMAQKTPEPEMTELKLLPGVINICDSYANCHEEVVEFMKRCQPEKKAKKKKTAKKKAAKKK
jgi:ParB/RepB/Spo0J family partition protein